MVSEEAILEYLKRFDDITEREEKGWKIFERGEKIFLCLEQGKTPVRLELRCDRKLGQTLQERYESVMESRALGRNGIEIICSGQLSEDEIVDLIRHAYEVSAD
jgi:predicted DNA-binding protein (MmcQ/YjbR family)